MARILICHRDEGFSRLLCDLLREEGYTVESAGDCNEALRRLLAARYMVFIIGIQGDNSQFMEFLPLMRSIDKAMALITIVDDDSIEVQKQIRKEKVFYHLVKPLDAAEIKMAVHDAVTKGGLRRARDRGSGA